MLSHHLSHVCVFWFWCWSGAFFRFPPSASTHLIQSHTCSCWPRLWLLVKSLVDRVKRTAGVLWRFYLCVGAYLFPCQQILETPRLKSSELFCVLGTEALDPCGFVDYPCRTEARDLPWSLSSVWTVLAPWINALNRLSKSCLTCDPLHLWLHIWALLLAQLLCPTSHPALLLNLLCYVASSQSKQQMVYYSNSVLQ